MFFPFVFLDDHLAWGLPQPLHQPLALLQAAWTSLAPGGHLMVVNQGEAEAEAQQAMFAALKIAVRPAFRYHSILYSYTHVRYVHVATRPT